MTGQVAQRGVKGLEQNQPGAVRWAVLAGFLGAGLATTGLLMLVFPDLINNPVFFGLSSVTALLACGSLGIKYSGWKGRWPVWGRWGYSVTLWSAVAVVVVVLVVPNFTAGRSANEADPFAASTTPAAVAPTTVTASEVSVAKSPGAAVKTTEATVTIKATEAAMVKMSEATAAITPTTEVAMVKTTERATAPTTVAPKATTAIPATATTISAPVTTVVGQGPFTGVISGRTGHRVSGRAVLGQSADGKSVLRFENLNAENGPDLVVYLSKDSNPATRETARNGIAVARLKATQGNSNYELGSVGDLSQYKSAVIYCEAFSVVFAVASLS